jgi:hypothetical protein
MSEPAPEVKAFPLDREMSVCKGPHARQIATWHEIFRLVQRIMQAYRFSTFAQGFSAIMPNRGFHPPDRKRRNISEV